MVLFLNLLPVSVLPFRSFALIYDKYFRNENTTDEIYIQKKGFSLSELIGDQNFGPNSYCGRLPKVNKYKDYFTSCVPNPQKGAPVTFNLGDQAVVRTSDSELVTGPQEQMALTNAYSGSVSVGEHPLIVGLGGMRFDSAAFSGTVAAGLYPNNLYADLSSANAISVDDLRLAFAYQKCLSAMRFMAQDITNIFMVTSVCIFPMLISSSLSILEAVVLRLTSFKSLRLRKVRKKAPRQRRCLFLDEWSYRIFQKV